MPSFMKANLQNFVDLLLAKGVIAVLCSLTFYVVAVPSALAQSRQFGCGPIQAEGQFGPYDYRPDKFVAGGPFKTHEGLLNIVERAHFTPEVEAGIRGKSSSRATGDISYTLRAFPNHHRALIAMANISIREGVDKPNGSSYTIDCWFQRAIAWRSDDVIVRLIYASHLTKTKRLKEAQAQADFAAANAGDNAFTHLNVGLVYYNMGNFEQALQHAHKSIALGLNNMTLKDLLVKEGKWSEPVPSPRQNADDGKS
jgi:tetratricopeptide (TPR) repeat protein